MYEIVIIKDRNRVFTLYTDISQLYTLVKRIKSTDSQHVRDSILIINKIKKGDKSYDFIMN